MRCPYCKSENLKVVDTRESSIQTERRRRECADCGKRFTTYERVEGLDITVIKKDGKKERFDGEKIIRGVSKACHKRNVSLEQIESLADDIEKELINSGKMEVPSSLIGEMVMEKLAKIDKVAYIMFAAVYREFKDIRSYEKELKKLKVVDSEKPQDATDISLMVPSSRQDSVSEWDREKIVSALVKEAGITRKEAEEIAKDIEEKVFSSGIKTISVNLIRALVDNGLFERGFTNQLKKQEIIGMPTYDVRSIIFSKSKDNSNIIGNNPEAINLAIAENTLKQFALKEIFSKDIAEAHLNGRIYLHNLGYPIRVYCSSHSIEYLKKYGLCLNNLATKSSPAKHAGTLTGHLNTFLASMQAYYAGALGIGYINIMYAPLLEGMDYKRMKQEAQYLIFSCSQNAFSRGGQSLFIDFNVHLGVPEYLEDVPAIGAGGKYTGKTYGDYEKEARMFLRAMMDVWKEGDSEGKVFPFPKMDLHINQKSFDDKEERELLEYACSIASINGSPYFVFDRDDVALSACCRLKIKVKDKSILKHPESMRFCGFQNVTINLPQAAYRADGDYDRTIKEIMKDMELCMKAHIQKKEFIQKLMDSPEMPMWQVGMPALDGRPYIELDKSNYIIGMIGLNECVKKITGKELHESEDSYKLGLKIISAMYLKIKEFEKEYGLKIALEESPAESASLRFARTDLKLFPESKDYVRGNQKTGEVYYTNSIHFVPDAEIDITERIEKQGKFHPLIESGAITHIFVGEKRPSAESIFNLVKKTWENTQTAQITISPEFTVCEDCHKISPGWGR